MGKAYLLSIRKELAVSGKGKARDLWYLNKYKAGGGIELASREEQNWLSSRVAPWGIQALVGGVGGGERGRRMGGRGVGGERVARKPLLGIPREG